MTAVAALTLGLAAPAPAQDNYEIQVYPAGLVAPAVTMLELHSNYTVNGLPESQGAFHETVEITHGFSEWLEVGFYTFTSAGATGDGWEYVGNHLRPRVSIPERWNWPVGLSLSNEIGYQRSKFSEDTWTWEVRPIVDQRLGRWYWSLNPVLDFALEGANAGTGATFAPNAELALDVTPKVNFALEYYGSFGPTMVGQLFPAVNLDFGPEWEFNAGVGFGLTPATDPLLVKVILGRRFGRP
ncbi:MAG TPA: hypothetical protein VMH88_12645 [Gemmatimonadales bacterium]|nr:hypothetical protein [Gemmatimonadales bacterium]